MRVFRLPKDGATWRCASCDTHVVDGYKVLREDGTHYNNCRVCIEHYIKPHIIESTAAWENYVSSHDLQQIADGFTYTPNA